MVITGRTRNAFALRGTRVRIPPTPLVKRLLKAFNLAAFSNFLFSGISEKFMTLYDTSKKEIVLVDIIAQLSGRIQVL